MNDEQWTKYRDAYEARRDAADDLAFHIEWCDRHDEPTDPDRLREYIDKYRAARAEATAANPTRDPCDYPPVSGQPVRWEGDGSDWSAMRQAEAWATSSGYSLGPTDRLHVRGVIFEPNVQIAKWHNLTVSERKDVDAMIVGSNRTGPLVLVTQITRRYRSDGG